MQISNWIDQFDYKSQIDVLNETKNLLKQSYFSKEKIENALSILLTNFECLIGKQPKDVNFLRSQRKGQSQERLLDILDSQMSKKYGYGIDCCGSNTADVCIYLDDAIFTGITVYNGLMDIRGDISSKDVFVLAFTSYQSAEEYIKSIELKVDISLQIITYENRRYWTNTRNQYTGNCIDVTNDCLWPKRCLKDINDNPELNNYINKIGAYKNNYYNLFRDDVHKTSRQLFLCEKSRNILEQQLLLKGLNLLNPSNDNYKPMGFNTIPYSLGFGAFFATCFNISNNCPLAFWWSEECYAKKSKEPWIPLLPRNKG